MAEWVYVEDNIIKEYHDLLPENWRNVSGLNLSKNDLPFLKSLGWFPVVKEYQSYDENYFRVDGYNYTIRENDVAESLILKEIEVPNLGLHFYKISFLTQLREERDRRLRNCDWTQLTDMQNKLSEEDKIKWLTYRQALRDLPELYLNDETTDINLVIWPEF